MIIPAKEQTSAAVAQHYDDRDPFYRELWGDHVHHGLWTTGLENPAQAVADSCDTSEGDPEGSPFAFTDVFY